MHALNVLSRNRAGHAHRGDYPPVGLPDEERFEELSHEEYERRLDQSSGYVRSKPKYSQIQKEKAVKHYAEHGRCFASTVTDFRPPVVNSAVSAPWPPQLKTQAVLELCTREASAQVVTQKLGVSSARALRCTFCTLSFWPSSPPALAIACFAIAIGLTHMVVYLSST